MSTDTTTAEQPDAGRLLSPAAVARLFGVDPRTVTRWANDGILHPITTPGGHRRYKATEVAALLTAATS